MRHFHYEQGAATLLLVLLVGTSAMLVTASMAKSMLSKKAANVAAHAQTNAQLIGWAGVSAFRSHLLQLGQNNMDALIALDGQHLVMRDIDGQQKIVAENIRVVDCETTSDLCTVAADISANHMRAKAATTIHVVYELAFKNGEVETAAEKVSLNFTGNTSFSDTTLRAEVPNSRLEINVKGNASLLAGLKLKNIDELTINATGDVLIDCGTRECGTTKIHVNSQGRVDLLNGGNYGVVRAQGVVSLSGAHPNMTRVEQIHSASNVLMTGQSFAQEIFSVGRVTLTAGANAGEINANGSVNLTTSSAQQIHTKAHVYISDSTVRGDVRAYHYVELLANAKVLGSIYAKGEQLKNVLLSPDAAVTHSASTVNGQIFAKGPVHFYGLGRVDGNIYTTVSVDGVQSVAKADIVRESEFDELNFTHDDIRAEFIRQQIEARMGFETKVDVTVYKDEANYIFTHNNGFSRVYLNNLYHKALDLTFIYEDAKQYQVSADGTKTLVNQNGFALGNYEYAGERYIGAICESTSSGICTSNIIGYFPRLKIGRFAGVKEDYDFTHTSPRKTWILRSTSYDSHFENANFAPGILYFEGDVALIGRGNLQADSSSSVFTNTILAEGDIRAEAVSPRIYSPYNLLREGDDKATLICDRILKDKDNIGSMGLVQTKPNTLSNTYLMPTNLCAAPDRFSYQMNRNPDGSKQQINIDGKSVDKLDLGYVALMANKNIAIGTCSRIYGDVYARSTIAGTASCGNTDYKNGIIGSIATQGDAPYLRNIEHMNTFTADSEIVVPNPAFTNAKNIDGTVVEEGLVIDSVRLKWSKYK